MKNKDLLIDDIHLNNEGNNEDNEVDSQDDMEDKLNQNNEENNNIENKEEIEFIQEIIEDILEDVEEESVNKNKFYHQLFNSRHLFEIELLKYKSILEQRKFFGIDRIEAK